MKSYLLMALLLAFGGQALAQQIKWTSIVKAQSNNQKNQKKYFVDIYTDWCGYCKKMDRSTLKDPSLAHFLNEHYLPVKFNAERREKLYWNGRAYAYRPSGYRGFNELAIDWLQGNMAFPAYIVLSADGKTVEKTILGFHTPIGLKLQLMDN